MEQLLIMELQEENRY